MGFPGGSYGKESVCNAGYLDLIPGLGRSPRERKGYPLQCSCLESSLDQGAWQNIVHGVAESDMTELSHCSLQVIEVSFVSHIKPFSFIPEFMLIRQIS